MHAVVAEITDRADVIGHVKFLIRDHLYDIKIGHTAADETPDRDLHGELLQLDRLNDRQLYVLVNARFRNRREAPSACPPARHRSARRWSETLNHPVRVTPPSPSSTKAFLNSRS